MRDLTNQRFGRLIALGLTEKRVGGSVVWECHCDCGNTVFVSSGNLTAGHTTSCGCLLRERASRRGKLYGGSRRHNLIGRRFGRLVVLRELKFKPRIHAHIGWLCRCECGNYKVAPADLLLSGGTRSCGCLRGELAGALNRTHGLSRTKEYVALRSRKRWETKKIHDSGWTLQMDQALRELQPVCVVCGSAERLEVDHVKPLSQGYGLLPGNAVMLCKSCNSRKWKRSLEELPADMATKIMNSAQEFKNHWERRSE